MLSSKYHGISKEICNSDSLFRLFGSMSLARWIYLPPMFSFYDENSVQPEPTVEAFQAILKRRFRVVKTVQSQYTISSIDRAKSTMGLIFVNPK